MLGVMRQRMTDGAMNRCDANVGRRRSSSLNCTSMKGFGQHEYKTLFRLFFVSTSSHSDDKTVFAYASYVVKFTCRNNDNNNNNSIAKFTEYILTQ